MATPGKTLPTVGRDRWALAYAPAVFHGTEAGTRFSGPDQVAAPTWLEPPAGRFYADPFLVKRDGQVWVLFEDYDATAGIGHIAASPLLDFQPQPALVREWHLSYPYLWEEDGELFCVPEQHQRGEVCLYRCLRFPDTWTEEAVLVPNFQGVDPTIIRQRDRYWMWIGEESRRARDNLFLFHAPALRGPWVEHRQSPAITSPDLARPAGRPWKKSGRWYRPAQDRRRTYGGGMVIYEVQQLSLQGYRERQVALWQPHAQWPYPDGLHHVCQLDAWTVWDAKRILPETEF
jgi:hypothetical protein